MIHLDRNVILKSRHLYLYKSKFFYLLLAFILYFIGTSMLVDGSTNLFYLSSLFSFIIVFCIYVITASRPIKFVTVMLALALLATHWILVLNNYNYTLHVITSLLTIIFLIIISYSVLATITNHQQITADTLLGAICGYFLVGLTWTYFYLLVARMDPTAFSGHAFTDSIHENTQHFFYYSYTTMTTLGYGDILPISNIARTLSWLEAITGQVYLAVWISQLVGLRIAQKSDANV